MFEDAVSTTQGGRWGDTAAINLNGATVNFRNANVQAFNYSETVGPITFDRGSVVNLIRGGSTNTTGIVTALVNGSITRASTYGTLSITNQAAAELGGYGANTYEHLVASTAPTLINGMVAPYIVGGTVNNFLTYSGSNVNVTAATSGSSTVTVNATPAGLAVGSVISGLGTVASLVNATTITLTTNYGGTTFSATPTNFLYSSPVTVVSATNGSNQVTLQAIPAGFGIGDSLLGSTVTAINGNFITLAANFAGTSISTPTLLNGDLSAGANSAGFGSVIGFDQIAGGGTAAPSNYKALVATIANAPIGNAGDAGQANALLNNGTEILDVSGNSVALRTNLTIMALRTANSISAGGTNADTITLMTAVGGSAGSGTDLGMGGIILNGAITLSTNLKFTNRDGVTAGEGLIYVTGTNSANLNGQILAATAITKFGTGTLVLNSDQNTFNGVWNLNQGNLTVNAPKGLGTGTVTLNGGAGTGLVLT